MKILIVSPYLPHPKSGHGTGVFMYELLQQLSSRHDITLISFCNDAELILAQDFTRVPIELLTVPRGKGVQRNLFRNLTLAALRGFQLVRSILLWQPYYVGKFHHSGMKQLVRRLTSERKFDIVQFEFASLAQYVTEARSGKKILHEHDVTFRPAYRAYKHATSLLRRAVLFIEWCRWSAYERTMMRQFDRVLCVTEQDKMLLEKLSGSNRISYFPRAVDMPGHVPEEQKRKPQTLLFVGTFSHRPNTDAALWLVREIFPLIAKRFPGSVLSIVGSDPPDELLAHSEHNPNIKVPGFVDDVAKYFQESSVFIAPLRFGGGVKVKILHAMALGIPVVTTRVGTEGIDGFEPGDALVGESASKLADCVCELFSDPSRASEVGKRGSEIVRRGYSWSSAVARLDKIYSDVLPS